MLLNSLGALQIFLLSLTFLNTYDIRVLEYKSRKRGDLRLDGAVIKNISKNKKAFHDYFVLESIEAGIELRGTEVKSIRNGSVNLKDSWCSITRDELFVNNMHIGQYDHGNIFNTDSMRVRKLLAHKKEINKFLGQIKLQGISIIPLSIYFKNQYVKLQIGLCKGKKLYDKRAVLAERSANRNIERTLKEYQKF